jgi:hypothetical protein
LRQRTLTSQRHEMQRPWFLLLMRLLDKRGRRRLVVNEIRESR